MKQLLSLIVLVVVFASATSAQWQNQGAWPSVDFKGGTGAHGLAVDPDGKVWVQPYAATDSIMTGGGMLPTQVIYVFNPDGSQASFSPIKTIPMPGGVVDTVRGNSGRGLRAMANGNIVASQGFSAYVINYQTGAGIAKYNTGVYNFCAAGVDDNNNIYLSAVLGGYPLLMFDENMNSLGNALDTINNIGRTLDVTGDGLTIFSPRYTANYVDKFVRQDEFSPFVFVDSAFKGIACESTQWDKNGRLWLSGGSYLNKPLDTTVYTPGVWYAFDHNTEVKLDSMAWVYTTPYSPDERPRAIDFSVDGKYAYVACFGGSGYPYVQRLYNPNVDVNDGVAVVSDYTLDQNFPNPFNPTTEIRFSLKNAGHVSLKVYDMLGNQVADLINAQRAAGTHTVSFDGKNLASGTYVYQLVVNNVRLANKMMLIK